MNRRLSLAASILSLFGVLLGGARSAEAQTQVTLSPSTSPTSGFAGVNVINVTGTNFPSGTISPSNVTVTLTPSGGGASAIATPSAVTTIIGTTRRVTFVIPKSFSVTVATIYQVTVSGSTSTGTTFTSLNSAKLTINPAASLMQVNPASLTYANQVIGTTSSQQSITVNNTGSTALTINSIALTGVNPAEFKETTNCPLFPATLAAGGNCAVQVTFQPLAVGTRTASVTFTDNSSGLPGSQQNVSMSGTASAAPPTTTTVPITFSPGTNVSQVATVNCPSGTTPCTDPNAHSVKVAISQVNTPFTLTVTAIEVPLTEANGVCEAGQDETTDFDCRFKTYFSLQTEPNGDVIVPQCIPISSGNCVFYRIGNIPPESALQGPILETISWNNNAFVPPSFYQANNPRLFYDPDTAPYDTNHQFVFDITDYFESNGNHVGVDPTIKGHTKQFCDFIVAFPGALPNPPYTFSFVSPLADGSSSFQQGTNAPVSFTLTQGTTPVTNAVIPPNATSLGLADSNGVRFPALAPDGTAAAFTYNPTGQQYVLTLATQNLPPGVYSLFVNSNVFLQQSTTFSITPAPLQITTTSALPLGATGVNYSQTFATAGGTPPFTWLVTNGTPPAGLALSSAGVLSGLPSSAAVSTFTVQVTDSASQSTSEAFTLSVTSSAPTLVSIAVTPVNPSLAAGLGQQFTAKGSYSDNTTQDLTGSVTWASSNATIATISTNGSASALKTGSTTISATSSGISGSTTLTVAPGSPASMTANGGTTPQSTGLNTAFAAPLAATVTDAHNNPVSGVNVTFTAPGSGASGIFSNSTSTITVATNAAGVASAPFAANSIAGGPYSVTASAIGLTSVNFSLTNNVGAVSTMTANAGTTPQSATINAAFANALAVTVKDAANNPVSGVNVTFSAPGSGASGIFSNSTSTITVATNAAGVAPAPFAANAIAGGSYVVTAAATGLTTVNFTLTNTAGAASTMTSNAGTTPQSTTVSNAFANALAVTVKDAGSNPVPGVNVTFIAPSTGASGVFSNNTATITVATNASGVASAPFTANATAGGPYVATASAIGLTTVNFSLTNLSGPAASIVITSGSGQSAQINTAFAAPLVATVTDAGSNPLNGLTVTFTAPGSGASGTFAGGVNTAVTNASGVATSRVFTANGTAGGPYNVAATVAGVGTPANFSLTNTVGTPGSMTANAGTTPQSITVNTAFPTALAVTVKDAGSNPVSGVNVTFTAPGTGASGVFSNNTATITVATNASGVASAPFTANATAGGPYNVTAAATGLTSVSFALTNTVGTPNSMTSNVGTTPQSTTISTAFANALAVTVKDAGNNPVAGVNVTFTAPSTGASGVFSNSTATIVVATNASGVASASFTANATAGGPYNVTASATGLTTANFSLMNIVGAPGSMTANTGTTPQTIKISTAFPNALAVTVKDAGNNAVSGVSVTFTAPGSGASGVFNNSTATITVATNASGIASAPFTANATAGGPYNVTATATGLTIVNFSLTNNPGAATHFSLTAPASAVSGTAFNVTVTALDAGNNTATGYTGTVHFTSSDGTATLPADGTLSTGTRVFSATLRTDGSQSITAIDTVTSSITGSATGVVVSSGTATSMTANAGTTPQSATINSAFTNLLAVTVKDAGNNPVSGVNVTFTAPGSGASGVFSNSTTTITVATNASGIASAPFTANAIAGGPYNVAAAATGLTTVNFSLTNNPGAALTMVANAGTTPQSATVSTAFANALAITVKDAAGNAVPGVNVTFTAPASGASGVFSNSTRTITIATNASGIASAPFTANATAGAGYTVTATATGLAAVNFSLTNTPGTASTMAANAGTTPQSATVSTAFANALAVTVKDASNNPVSGVNVTFTAPGSGASGVFSNSTATITVATNASGIASAPFTANATAGAGYTVTATATGLAAVNFSLTNTPGTASTMTANAGTTPQSATVSNAFPNALAVTVKDVGGNVVPGVNVTFTAPGSGASGVFSNSTVTITVATNASGVASAPFTANAIIGGPYTVTASSTGLTSVNFSLTNLVGSPTSMAANAGTTPQSATISTAFTNALAVTVKDIGNNPVPGVNVTFTAPGSGASGLFSNSTTTITIATNASGVAAAPFTANATSGGPYAVTALTTGLSSVVFSLTNTTTASLVSASPNTGQQAQTLSVVLTGQGTHFGNGTTTTGFGAGITVNSVTVTSATSATASITISALAITGLRTVTVTTGAEVVSLANGFTVQSSGASVLSLTPNSGNQAQTLSVAIVGSQTNFVSGTTVANFGPNIAINSLTVTDATHASANITIGTTATLGPQTVTMTTSGEVASSAPSGFTILAGVPAITSVVPATGKQGDIADTISLTAQFTHFVQGTTTASFGAGITVSTLTVNSPTTATASIAIDPSAAPGSRNVALTTGTEVANDVGGFTVIAQPTATLNPNFAVQGTSPTITISGLGTHFTVGLTTVSLGLNVTVGTVTVNGPTLASVPIQIDPAAVIGSRTVTITTGSEVVNASFNITQGVPSISVVNPNVGRPAQSLSVTVTGNFTNWSSGITQASFGPGIAVGGAAQGASGPVSVNGPGSFTASLVIDSAATLGPRDVVVKTNTDEETASGGFSVLTCTTTAAAVITTSPAISATNVPLNTTVELQYNAPINRTTVTTSSFYLYDGVTGLPVPATVSVDASGRILKLVPSQLLGVNRGFSPYITNAVQDSCGNVVAIGGLYNFTTGYATQSTGPTVVATSPLNNDTNIPLNAQVQLKFSEPISPITQPAGLTVTTGGVPVPGAYSFSPDSSLITFVSGNPLLPATSYTVSYNSQLQDAAANPLVNPGSFSFTTGSSSDITAPQVVSTDPYNGETGVGTNTTVTVYFSKIVNPLTVIPTTFYLANYNTGKLIATSITVAADRLSATLTTSAPLEANTAYGAYVYGFTDIAGNTGGYSLTYSFTFTTAGGTDTTPATVSSINPPNGTTGVPVNTQIIAVMSDVIDPGSVGTTAITVTPQGGSAIAGTVTLANDQLTLTFLPSTPLAVSTTYTIHVSSFRDTERNLVTPFSSTFMTGTIATGVTNPNQVSTITPGSTATGVGVLTSVVLTYVDSVTLQPVTLNPQSVNFNTINVRAANSAAQIAGALAVSGNQVTFTPLASSPYPGNTVITVTSNGNVLDVAGNGGYAFSSTFTTANTVDTTAPTVTSVTPANNTTNVGRNTAVVLTFSKALNPATVTPSSVLLYNGDVALGVSQAISADNRAVSLNYGALPAGATITVIATHAVQDLSGNSLADFRSQFTVGADIPVNTPTVVTQRPAYGATDVPTTTVITLFTNGNPLNPATVVGSLHVSQNGVLITGTTQLSGNNQAIEFTPSVPFIFGALVQVFLDSSAQDIAGNVMQPYSGQFTVQGNPASVGPLPVASNPFNNSTGVALNVLLQGQYDQALAPGTVIPANVFLTDTTVGGTIGGTLSLVGNGKVVQFQPTSALPANHNFQVTAQNLTNTSGVAASTAILYFSTGTASDSTAPTVTAVAPQNGTLNVGINATIRVIFSKTIDPISVNGSTIQISGAGQTEIPASITFDATGTIVTISPLVPLLASTQITVAINGVTDPQGNFVVPKSTLFTTGIGPDTAAANVITVNPDTSAVDVPTNSPIIIQFNKQMDPTTVNSSTFAVFDGVTGLPVAGTMSGSADMKTFSLIPSSPLPVGRTFLVFSGYAYPYNTLGSALDLTGNPQAYFTSSFTTSFVSNSAPPQVVNTNPENGVTAVPTNTIIQVSFNAPVRIESLGQVQVLAGGTPISVTPALTNADQLLSLTPAVPLTGNTTYTISITGVRDFAGNTLVGTVTHTFTTGPTIDLVAATVIATDPTAGEAGVGTNTEVKVVFSKIINPLSLNPTTFYLNNYNTGKLIATTITVAADRKSATLTPTAPLQSNTPYSVILYGYSDIAGNLSYSFYGQYTFTTAAGTDTTPATVSSINPPNATTGAPVNTQIIAVMSDGIDPSSISASSIAVTPQSGSAIAGTVTLASDQATLTFVPATPLGASTTYSIHISGFRDTEGNLVTPFTSIFTTGSSATAATDPNQVNTISPVSGATGVGVLTPIVLTYMDSITLQPVTLNPQTVNFNTIMVLTNNSQQIAGTFAVSGAQVTFTPLATSPYPGNTVINVTSNGGVQDVAGNGGFVFSSSFTTANTVDTTAPTVTTVTPTNNSINVGRNTTVVLTFSKSLNPASVTGNSVLLYDGDMALSVSSVISADNRTVSLNYGALPAGTTITVIASNAVQDLSGNSLTNFRSQFTVAADVLVNAPAVVTQRPASGATDVPATTLITLFTNGNPLNPATVTGALHISQNGVLVGGTIQLSGNGQAIEFTPSVPFTLGAYVQVFLDASAQDTSGNAMQPYSGQFTVQGNPATVGPVVVAYNPMLGGTETALNVLPQVQYDQGLAAGTVIPADVFLTDNTVGGMIAGTLSLVGNGKVVQFQPTSALPANHNFQLTTQNLTNTNGVAAPVTYLYFTTGTASDSTAPTVVSVGPPNGVTGVGVNALVVVTFNKAVNPISVTGSTIQISGGGQTEIPSSITFDSANTTVTITPQMPLAANTLNAIAINGVTDAEGNPVTPKTTTFTTGAGPDTVAPLIIQNNVPPFGSTVPTNYAVTLQFNKPMDPGSINSGNFGIYDATAALNVAGSISISSDLKTATFVPNAPLIPGHAIYPTSGNAQDLAGNYQQNGLCYCYPYFNQLIVGATADTTPPQVIHTSPTNGIINVGINAPIQIEFSELISPVSIGQISLLIGSTPVAVTPAVTSLNQVVTLTPNLPLDANTTYTISVTGVKDTTGNTIAGTTTSTFTTGPTVDYTAPTLVSITPTNNATSVSVNTTITLVFSKAMNPVSFDLNNGYLTLATTNTSTAVPFTVSFSADFKTVTLTPTSALTAATQYTVTVYGGPQLTDVSGNPVATGATSNFTTQ